LAAIPIYTEKHVGTWQSIPDIQEDDGDFSGKQHLSPTTSYQAHEGIVEQHHITFADEVAQNDTDGPEGRHNFLPQQQCASRS
jgi:hypothetical protein